MKKKQFQLRPTNAMESAIMQEFLFKMGYTWAFNGQTIVNMKPTPKSLFAHSDGSICYSDAIIPSEDVDYPLMSYWELLGLHKVTSSNKIDLATFDDPKQFKTIPFIVDRINEMDKHQAERLLRFFQKFNKVYLQLEEMLYHNSLQKVRKLINKDDEKPQFNVQYFLEIIGRDYNNKFDKLSEDYDEKLISYSRNYIQTKLKKLRKNIKGVKL